MPKDTFLNLPQEKQTRIIEAAKKAFSESHYNKVTIDTIVKYAKIPKGSFYQYFTNKDDLFKFIFEGIGNDKYDELLNEIQSSSHMAFSDLIVQLIIRANQFENKDEVMIGLKDRFLNECSQEVKEEILLEVMPKSMKLFENIISIYIKNGEIRKDINIRTTAFMITSTVLNIDKYVLEDENNHGEVLRNAIEILFCGIKS